MESQLQKTHHVHGHHYDEHDALTHATGHDHNEDEHHEKKSVIKKVKEKAKKLKNKITHHGHGHEHDDEDDEDDDDDETVEDPEVHGAPMYDSARVGQLGGPQAILSHQRHNLEKPTVIAEDRYAVTKPVSSHGPTPHVSTGAYGANLSEPSGLGHGLGLGLGHHQTYGHEVHPEKWRAKVGQPTGMEEDPFSPNPTRVDTPMIHVSGPKHGKMFKASPRMKHVSSDPVSFHGHQGHDAHKGELKGGKEVDLSKMQHSFDNMGIGSNPKSYDPNHPENLPRDTLTGNQSSKSSSYTEKISSSASAIADKAAAAKDVIASKLGYSGQNQPIGGHETDKNTATVTDYAHVITDKVTGTLAPVYEKVVDAGSTVVSKVQGTVSGTGSGAETGTMRPQVHHGGSGVVAMDEGQGADKGVSVKEYLVETLRPGDEDKALSDVISHALHRGHEEESEKKSGQDRPMGIVTESVEVRRRLGTDRHEEHQQQHHSGNVSADKPVSDRLRDAVGSWFGGKGDAPQGTLGTSYVTDQGLSSNPRGDQKS
ncbi:low-temperature-induced 65 kDa protein-like protein [Tanacetum coccineum]